ncbi:methionyl-tRNA formyltransferase [Aquimarina sp. ERC-38]|uniref:methionyl-tRNA formyltransferase n=1 Tax=Aquimarina sp. ERC-38 TaxID=2949996 RepID=UPI002245200C|nr:methionyl-tRNA formyltransferase [Aquimarina sp. ERC-38]UZO80179.1 methionyl-tRNA formyltransferase [Aquimarina sp. ERC-38]
MRTLRIVFMGTPEFAVASLKTIVENNYQVVGVITAPDRPAGRGRQLKESAVKQFALSQQIPVLQPINLKNPDFIKELALLEANVQVVVAFRMLPKIVWEMPEYGTFNLHASLLPLYRGAAPINWAIINGEEKTGVTTFFIDEKIDTGMIINQEEVAIREDDNAGTLHDRLMASGADLVSTTLRQIKEDTISVIKQPSLQPEKTAFKLTKENTRINWNQPASVIHNFIRGLSPYPVAWTSLNNNNKTNTVKIYEVSIVITENKFPIGQLLIEDNQIKVSVPDGFVILHQIQLPGKKVMSAKALLNGYQFAKEARLK